VEENFILSANLSNFFDGLYDSDLVVNHNDRDDDGVRSNSLLELLQINQTIGLYGQISHIEAQFLQVTAAVKHALVVDLRSDNMFFAGILLIELCHTLQS
jgi:hypothetical protein